MTGDIIYLIGGDDSLREKLDTHGARLCIISVPDWNRDLSPWPAKAVFGDEDFEGGADNFLRTMRSEVLPAFETGWCEAVMNRYVVGYSLAGLFALYALHHSKRFTGAAAVSGSYWFDGFTEYVEKTPFRGMPKKIYLSLGDQEAKTRNERMAQVEAAGEKLCEIYRARGVNTCWEMNPGNHFADEAERIQKAIDWLCAGE